MWSYVPPLRDMQFVIEAVLDAPAGWRELPAFAELDADTARQILDEAGRYAAEVLAPTNGPGDLQGCRWSEDGVKTPDGYPAAYRAFVDGGWPALACDPACGGQGLPQLLNTAVYEMTAAANNAWAMYPGLLHGAYECLHAHGSAELRERYLPKIVSGEWLSTMCLTEPQAGSDLGLVRTRAEPVADGSYAITGAKIFISGGDQDLTDNIVHLVLARLPGAPAGTKGLTLLLCPKFLPDGTRNTVRCDGIEKKMGIKGSATCALSFERATGWLVGEPHRGLAAMFVMMNAARLHVAVLGLGQLEIATQNALRYAHERLQMRAVRPDGSMPPADTADPIVMHPAVRATLWRLRALAQGERVLAFWTAQLIDDAEQHAQTERRERAHTLVSLLTPVLKAMLTENGFLGASEALQVWGGYGYVHEYGIEQAVRDARIAMIYEGTNEIQAVDLLQRKVLGDGGERFARLLAELDRERAACAELPALADFAEALRQQIAAMRGGTSALLAGRGADPEWPLRVADAYRHGVGLGLLAWAWARCARAALPHVGEAWYDDQLRTARYGIEAVLPQAAWRWQQVAAQHAALPALPEPG